MLVQPDPKPGFIAGILSSTLRSMKVLYAISEQQLFTYILLYV